MRILIIEDDTEKLRHLLTAVQEVSGISIADIATARCGAEGKRILRDEAFDLLILDVALPERPDLLPAPDGGVALLEEMLARDIYKRPREIVGLTAYVETKEVFAPRFAQDLWDVVLYRPESDDWRDLIKRKLAYLLSATAVSPQGQYESDLCIITALPEIELKAVLNLPWQWETKHREGDCTVYHHGSVFVNGDNKRVIACCTPRMGMTAAAVTTTKAICAFRPRFVAMVGIAAGVRGSVQLGDVIAADSVWDWGSGKHVVEDGHPSFAVAPHQISMSSFVRGKLAYLATRSEKLDSIRRTWAADTPQSALNIHLGPMATGAAVLADPAIVAGIRAHNRKLLGVEMELYGVYGAVDEACDPKPQVFGLKAVCDFGDEDKTDRFQRYAAYASVQVLAALLELL